MIKAIKGNVLDIDRGIIVHGCNSHGVMGAGIALQIKERFPEVFKVYANSNLQLGHNSYASLSKHKFIVNAITQQSTGIGKQVSYDAVESCFIRLLTFRDMVNKDLPICFPMIGAGLGGGNWEIISTIIDQTIPDTIEKNLYVLF